MVKIINRYYKIVWLKSTGRFREHKKIPSNKLSELIDVVKRKRILANVANFSLRWLYNDETRHIPTKSRKSINSWSNRIWNPIANVSVKVQYENISNLKPNLQINKFNPNSREPIFTNSMKEKRSVSKFFRLCLKKVLAPASRLVRIWKCSSFSQSQQAKITFLTPRGTPKISCIKKFFSTSKNNFCEKRSRTWKDPWQWKKTWKTSKSFSELIKELINHYFDQ